MTKLKFFLPLLLFVFMLTSLTLNAQRDKNNKPPKKSILDNLPEFFVSDAQLPPYLKEIYKRDATRIAVRLLSQEQRLSKQTVKVPEELVLALYNAMVAVRISDFKAIDTIAEHHNVRSFPIPNVENLILVFEHDDPRIQQVKRKRIDTLESPGFNRALREYDLRITRLSFLDEERAGMVLQARQPINVNALAYQFFLGEGIGSVEEVLPYGDGNDIKIERTKKGWDISYSVGFGNCTNQCQKRHEWFFEVSETGEVNYKGSQGQVIPPWVMASASLPKDKLTR